MPSKAEYAKICENPEAYKKLMESKRKYNNTMVKCDICHLEMKKLHYNRHHRCIADLYDGWEEFYEKQAKIKAELSS